MLKVKKISVEYGGRRVLSDASLELREDIALAVVGANGAGKSTLLRAMNGTVGVSLGEIEIGGNEISTMSRREIAQSLAVVAQENETRFPITVSEFVLAGGFASGGAFGWESQADIASASKAIGECDLTGYESRLMNELSGGERQRVVLARAIATNARILLLDEPTANLDLAHQASMLRLIRKRCLRQGYSAVVIAHDLNLVAQFADEVVMLQDGKVHAYGKPRDVLTEQNVRDVFGVDVLLDAIPPNSALRVTHIL